MKDSPKSKEQNSFGQFGRRKFMQGVSAAGLTITATGTLGAKNAFAKKSGGHLKQAWRKVQQPIRLTQAYTKTDAQLRIPILDKES